MNKYLIILILLLGFQVKAQDKRLLFYLDQAEKEFKQRKYADALTYLEKYFAKDSSNQLTHFRAAQIHESYRNTPKAIEHYLKTVELDSNKVNYPQAYMYLGTRYLEINDYPKALHYLKTAEKSLAKTTKAYEQVVKQIATAEAAQQAMQNPLDINPVALNSTINARQKQYFPVLTADDQTIVFTAIDKDNDENLYMAQKVNNEWTEAVSLSSNINTLANEGTCSISADGKIMVFTSCENQEHPSSRKSYGNCDLYISYKKGEEWSVPENLGPNVNSPYWDSQPSLSPDGSKLYFSSDRPYGYGKKDIWVSHLDENGEWTKAENLGADINSPFNEISPFVHANGKTLFYSSNGKPGMGNHDIFMTDIQKGYHSPSVNLGYPINTSGDETGLFITADGKTAFYSQQTGNSTKIYTFNVPQELHSRFEKVYYIKGIIKDQSTQKPLKSSIEIVNAQNGNSLSKFWSDPINGDYMTTLPSDGKYILYAETPGYFFKSITFDLKGGQPDKDLNISLQKIEKESKQTLNNIFFDTGSYTLRPESNIELDKWIKTLEIQPSLKVEISGHTDDVGNEKSNLELSNKRAQAVVQYFTSKGIQANRLIAKGYGETQPKVVNNSDANRQLNRRIELKVL